METVSLLGCGLMGSPMGKRLLDAGFALTVWNRSAEKCEDLVKAGARLAATPADAARASSIVITMLTDGLAVKDVLFNPATGVAQAMNSGSLLIDMSSITPAQAKAHAQQLQALGVACLDAPVSGGTLGAQAGTLAIMVGGSRSDMARALPVLECLGRPIHVGPHGCGQLTKLANQIIVGVSIGAVAEALLLVKQGGADMAQARLALRGGFAESRVLEVHGQRMVEGDFAKRGSLAVQLKDLRNAMDTAVQLGFDAPITQHMMALFEQAADHGDANLDQSALFLELARRQSDDQSGHQAPK
jgi:3-hydroxyisobutyrate dehydrogenase-like beta-hydroxyacid dehydrogenase